MSLTLVLLLASTCDVAAEGRSLVVTETPIDVFHRHQPLPGELDYDDLAKDLVWSSKETNVSTAILVEDLDKDGFLELVFGTDRGKLIAIELGFEETILDIHPTEQGIQDLVVGDVDRDKKDELVFSTSDGLYCWDYDKKKMLWDEPMDAYASELHLVELTEPDGTSVRDILVLWSDGDPVQSPSHHIARFTGKGERVWSTDLLSLWRDGWVYLGPQCSGIAADLDGDGEPEVFVSDRGALGYDNVGWGRHIWVLDPATGAITTSLQVGQTQFVSRPNLVTYDDGVKVAIGLVKYSAIEGYQADVLLYDGKTHTHEMLDVQDSDVYWDFVTFVPGSPSDFILLSSGQWRSSGMHLFSMEDPAVNWSRLGVQYGPGPDPLTCDIDDDGEMEIIAPGGEVHIIDALSGGFEAQITGEPRHTARNIAITLADLDDDRRTELVFGYYDFYETRTYYLFLMGDVSIELTQGLLSEEVGWGIIIFIVVANLILIAMLIRDWYRPRPDED